MTEHLAPARVNAGHGSGRAGGGQRRAACRWVFELLLGFFVLLMAHNATAYPQYIGRGDSRCADCHYSPTGGGLLNSWGRERRPSSFDLGNPEDWFGHGDASGVGATGSPEFGFDVGGDVRTLPLLSRGDSPGAVAFIPMLIEVGAVAAYGPLQLYGTMTLRKGVGDGPPYLLFSREHWLKYALNSRLALRAGRMVLPFGIRTPDHTQYVREDFGFDKYNQSYALELDWTREDLTLSAAGFAGDPVYEAPDRREAGGALRGSYFIVKPFEVGVSALVGRSDARNRVALGPFLRVTPVEGVYVLGEFAYQKFDYQRSDQTLSENALFGRAGWFVLPALDVYLEAGYRKLSGGTDFDKLRYAVGANWQLYKWFEFIPQLMVEQQDAGTQLFAMGQLHLIY